MAGAIHAAAEPKAESSRPPARMPRNAPPAGATPSHRPTCCEAPFPATRCPTPLRLALLVLLAGGCERFPADPRDSREQALVQAAVPGQLRRISEQLRSLDWRLHEVVVMPVASLEEL